MKIRINSIGVEFTPWEFVRGILDWVLIFAVIYGLFVLVGGM